ncbi:hypothetical protein Leryth_014927 [Lithospermum erythrorhizon]|nr:hypothetical protein Leryth_014927 [Lithospermum erythrorhizon]
MVAPSLSSHLSKTKRKEMHKDDFPSPGSPMARVRRRRSSSEVGSSSSFLINIRLCACISTAWI